MKKAVVKALVLDKVSNSPVVLLGIENTRKILPIWIGPCEASVLAMAIEKVGIERPLTHDLLLSILQALDAKLEKVIIHTIKDNVFYAKLILRDLAYISEEGEDEMTPFIEIDARPSDSIILAMKENVPIYVTNEIINTEAIELDNLDDTSDEEFKNFVEQMDINEFKKLLDDKEKEEGE